MSWLSSSGLADILATYGYWAVFGLVALESAGLPLPGETALISAAIYAGTTHKLDIGLLVAAASGGAILGDNVGYWVGRKVGSPLLLRYRRYIHLDEDRLALGQYLFRFHGGKIVFFGRFIAMLRAIVALLAGMNRMEWKRFFLANACGGIAWATLYGLGAYSVGHTFHRLAGPVRIATLVVGLVAIAIFWLVMRRRLAALRLEATQMTPNRREKPD